MAAQPPEEKMSGRENKERIVGGRVATPNRKQRLAARLPLIFFWVATNPLFTSRSAAPSPPPSLSLLLGWPTNFFPHSLLLGWTCSHPLSAISSLLLGVVVRPPIFCSGSAVIPTPTPATRIEIMF
jgi:hypothetical protein